MSLIDPDYQEPKPKTGSTEVLRMRDEFIQLAQCLLTMRQYTTAIEAADLAHRLEKFEDDHAITYIVWPPRLVDDPDGPAGKDFEETRE